MNNNSRLYFIDLARAMAIFAIVLGHSLRGASIYPWLYSFNVPLCIILTGISFSVKNKTFITLLKSRFFRLMIPYYAFSVISIIVYLLIGDRIEAAVGGEKISSARQYFWGMIWGNAENGLMRWNMPLWYLPMIFVMEILAFSVFHYIDDSKGTAITLCGSMVLAFVLYHYVKPNNWPFAIETVVYLFPFFCLGKLISFALPRLQSISQWKRMWSGIFMITVGTVLEQCYGSVDYVSDAYRDYYTFVVIAALISIGIILICSVWTEYNKAALFLGVNTLPVLLMHKFLIMFFYSLYAPTKRLICNYPLFGGMVIACLSIAMCLLFGAILQRIFPWAVGKTCIINRENSI